jgi:TolA-binding protein
MEGVHMKKSLLFFLAVLFAAVVLFACSDKKEAKSERGAIEKMTDQAAEEMGNRIRTPLEQARSVKDQEEDRLRDMESAVKED